LRAAGKEWHGSPLACQQRRLAFTPLRESRYDKKTANRLTDGVRGPAEYGDQNMHTAILLAAAALGIDYGWQPLDGGGLEYLIQIPPELLDAMRAGEALRSDLPPALRDVRSYRITVGRGELPQIGLPPAQPPVDDQLPQTQQQQKPPQEAGEPSQDPPAANPLRDRWSPPFENRDRYQLQPPSQRYPDHNFRTETPKPELPAETTRSEAVAGNPPRAFEVDPASTALITQTSAYGPETTKAAEATTSAKDPLDDPPVPKPWLTLTASLLCLFVSLGGNAYLGLQWWGIRTRCQQLLRERRRETARLTVSEEDSNADVESSSDSDEEEPDEDDDVEDEENQDVRAITEEELPRAASRERKRPELRADR
jgi:hypothetical protein